MATMMRADCIIAPRVTCRIFQISKSKWQRSVELLQSLSLRTASNSLMADLRATAPSVHTGLGRDSLSHVGRNHRYLARSLRLHGQDPA
jgi:hypothetical protein